MNRVSFEKIVVHYRRHNRTMFAWSIFFFLGMALSSTFAVIALSPIHKAKLGRGCIFAIFMAALMLLERSKKLFLNKDFFKSKWFDYISFFITLAIMLATLPLWSYIPLGLTTFKILSSTLIVCCISIVVYTVYELLSTWDSPVIRLDQYGILVSHIGFIPWNNIASITPYTMVFDDGTRGVCIKVKDTTALAAQADWLGKLRLLLARVVWQRLSRTDSHIYVSTVLLDTSTNDIIAFTNQYMQNKLQG